MANGRGWYRMHRGWMDSPVFTRGRRREFSDREAWVWLIESAAYASRTVSIQGRPHTLEPGQLTYSLRYLASAWGWSVKRVRLFLGRLQEWSMVGTETGTGQSVLTICNYAKYQSDADDEGTDTGTERAHEGHSKGTNNKKVKKVNNNGAREGIEPPGFAEWWLAYPHKVGRGAAVKAYRAAARKADPDTLLSALGRYVKSKPADRQWCNPATWLNQERWLDQPDVKPVQSDTGGRSWAI